MTDRKRYEFFKERQEQEWEQRCRDCGACCGLFDGDPCEHLELAGSQSRCRIYHARFGLHQTISGQEIRCVPIRNILNSFWPGSERCAYKRARPFKEGM